jgi:succinate dehydrogenase / fumarate reductase cytochrome b subunit
MSTLHETHFFLRRFQSLLGIIPVGVFLVEHAYTNALAFFYGAEKFNEQVLFLQSLPFVLFLEVFFIGLPILLHALIGFYIWWLGLSNVQNYGYWRNWLYALQRWSGIVAFVFIVYHVYKLRIEWVFTTDLHHIQYEYVNAYFEHAWHVVFYFIGVLAACFHFGNGIWNFLIKWGITVGDRAQQISMYICLLLGLGVFAFFISSLYAFSS